MFHEMMVVLRQSILNVFLLLWMPAMMTLFSCGSGKAIRDGETAFALKKFQLAVSLFGKEYGASKDEEKRKRLSVQIAETYRLIGEPGMALQWYKKAAESGAGAEWLYQAGLMQKQLEEYENAIQTFKAYAKAYPEGETAARIQIRACKSALDWKVRFSRTELSELKSLNSTYNDFAPVFYKGQLFFSGSRKEATGDFLDDWNGEKFSDLFAAEKSGGKYSQLSPLPAPLNTAGHEASCTFGRDGNEIYFTRVTPDAKGNVYNAIYFSQKNAAGEWDEPVKMAFFADTINCGDPMLSADGKQLFFVSDAPGGFGNKDIYYCNRTPGGWSAAVNAGTFVNTAGNERYPSVQTDGVLYFSSDGLAGMGGLDLYRAVKDKNIWRNPENLLPPFNSGADDFGISFDKYSAAGKLDSVLRSGYFSSARKGGTGGDDIYRFEEKVKNQYILVGFLKEKKYKEEGKPDIGWDGFLALPGGRIELRDVQTDSLIAINASDGKGEFSFKLQPNRDYRVNAAKNGYFSGYSLVSTKGKRSADSLTITIRTEIEVERIFPSREVVIPNIYYDYDKASLRAESMQVLDSLLIFFKRNKGLTIEIGSHTDSRGSDEYNETLSQARAESVVSYLISKGLAAESLQAKGYGESRPVNACINEVICSEEEHQKNRRTTFRVVGMDMQIQSVEPTDVRVVPKPLEEDELK